MIDITEKRAIKRTAIATGKIILQQSTIQKIKNNQIKKGDVFEAAKIAGLNAVKQTQLLIPYCHQIPIEGAKFEFETEEDEINVICTVKTTAKTGVEMEALMGISLALNTIWDMTKYLEKDSQGQYPTSRMTDIHVLKKTKEE